MTLIGEIETRKGAQIKQNTNSEYWKPKEGNIGLQSIDLLDNIIFTWAFKGPLIDLFEVFQSKYNIFN